MKTILSYFLLVFIFLLSVPLHAQSDKDNQPAPPVFNSVRLQKTDAQPLKNAVIFTDSLGYKYVQLTLKVLPSGLLEAPEGSGIDGSSLIPFKGLTPEEVEYITSFINFMAAKHKVSY